jgi:DNA-binding HxlR family transcriptional regulator
VAFRPYGQYCAVARSLDLVGERWTLLIVRDLLDGPKRYSDLLKALTPISTDLLASRLRDLEANGLIVHRPLPAPAKGRCYELTPDGVALEPVINSFVRWGRRFLDDLEPHDSVRPEWLARAARALLKPNRQGADLVVRLNIPEGSVAIHVTESDVRIAPPTAHVDVDLTGDANVLARALDPGCVADLVRNGELVIEGSKTAIDKLVALFE